MCRKGGQREEVVMEKDKIILIVDDSEMNRELLTDMLADEYTILEAENGMEASAILHDRGYEISLVLPDIVMPVMDGFELLAVMNKNGWIKSIPVIMISAETVPIYVDRAYDLGVLDYISRPFDERIVRRRVVSTLMLSAKQKELSHMVAEQIYEKEKDNKLMIEILSNLVEFRNGESGLHVLHIHALTEIFLKKLLEKTDRYQMTQKEIALIANASALHDIGKIAVPSEILNKPGRLTKEEFEVMKTHSAEGGKILQNIPMREEEPLIHYGYQICRWHHERYDGRGYPDGLKGEEIPIAAQVVALADVYDALTSKRVYKDAFSHDKAIQMILNGECGTFNPLLLECLEDVADTLEEEFKLASLGHDNEREMIYELEKTTEKGELDAPERMLHVVEYERAKNRFYMEKTEEIWFEFTLMPEMLMLSEKAAEHFGLPQIILNPREWFRKKHGACESDFARVADRLSHVTAEDPVLEEDCYICTGDKKQRYKVNIRTVWDSPKAARYTGAFGKMVELQ